MKERGPRTHTHRIRRDIGSRFFDKNGQIDMGGREEDKEGY